MTTEPTTLDAALVELTQLRNHVAKLEQQFSEHGVGADTASIYYEALTSLPLGIVIYHFEDVENPASLRIIMANQATSRFTGSDFSAFQGMRIAELIPIDQGPIALLISACADVIRTNQMCDLGEIPMDVTATENGPTTEMIYSMRVFPLSRQHVCLVFDDVTSRKQAETALVNAKLQEEVIRAQEAALAELSTPLLTVGNGVVVMPLVGTIDSRRAGQVMERLLEGVSATNARAVILDITGIPVVDTQVANAFIHAAQAVKLLGAQVILTGIRPEVAQTLVSLQVDLSGIITRATLESGIAEALGTR